MAVGRGGRGGVRAPEAPARRRRRLPTQVLVLEEAAQQQATHLLHGVLGREADGGGQVALPAAPLHLAQEVLPDSRDTAVGTAKATAGSAPAQPRVWPPARPAHLVAREATPPHLPLPPRSSAKPGRRVESRRCGPPGIPSEAHPRRGASPSRCGPGRCCPPGPAGTPGSGRPGHASGRRGGTCWWGCRRGSCSGPRPSPRCSCSGSGWSAGLPRRWTTAATLGSKRTDSSLRHRSPAQPSPAQRHAPSAGRQLSRRQIRATHTPRPAAPPGEAP